MAIVFNKKTKKYEVVKRDSGNKELERLLGYADKAGVEVPESTMEKGPSLLNKLFGFLNVGETAPAAMAALEGEDPISAYAKSAGKRITGGGLEGPTYSDVLEKMGMPEGDIPGPIPGSARGAAGLGLDILLDPMTYFGGGVMKGAAKVLGKGAKVGAKIAKPVGKVAVKGGSKLPVVGGKIATIADDATEAGKGIMRAFDQHYDMKQIGPEGVAASDAIKDLFRGVYGKTGRQIKKFVEKIATDKPDKVASGDYLGAIVEALEKNVKVDGVDDETIKFMRDLLKDMGEKEMSLGVLNTMIGKGQPSLFDDFTRGYYPRSLTKVGKDFFNKGIHPEIQRLQQMGIKHGPEFNVKFMPDKTVPEINKIIGKKIYEDDPIKAISLRIGKGVQRIETANFYNKLVSEVDKLPFASSTKKPGWVRMDSKVSGFNIPGLNEVYVPKEVYEEFNKVGDVLTNEDSIKGFLGVYDKALSFFKGSVTARFPAFHVRNAYGAVFNNYILGVSNPKRYADAGKLVKGVDEAINIGGKKFTYKELNDKFYGSGVVGDQGFFDMTRTTEQLAEDIFKKPSGVKGKLKSLIPGREWMNTIEGRARGALWLDRLHKGDTFEEAARMVIKGHFDYLPTAGTAFEKQTMKRVIPFYTWMRGNVPLQLEQIVKQPSKYANIGKMLRTVSGTEEEKAALPEYMRESFPIKMGEKDGLTNYLYSLGLPIEDINRLNPKELAQQVSPFLTVPFEIATGQNLFFGKPLEETNYIPDYLRSTLSKIPEPLQKAIGFREYEGKDGKMVGRVNPEQWRALTSILGRYVYTLDTMTDEESTRLVRILETVGGVRARTVDIDEEQTRRGREAEDRLGQYLQGQGVTYPFKKWAQSKTK